jgi:predicted ester cyclase
MTANTLQYTYQRWIDALNKHDISIIDALYSLDFIEHNSGPDQPKGQNYLSYMKTAFERTFTNIPDYQIQLLNSVVDEAKGQLAFYQVITGTHSGTIMNTPATGKPIRLLESGIVRIENGLFVERWLLQDRFSLVQQIGAKL